MKKIILSLALLPIFVHADGELAAQDNKWQKAEQTPPPPFIEYHNRMAVFDPFHQVYERTKPDALYAGVEAWIVGAYGSKGFTGLLEAEFRMGYNFFYSGRHHLTPLVGVGILKDVRSYHYATTFTTNYWGRVRHHKHRSSLPAVAYGVFGVLYDHEFNSVVNLGVNLKGMIGGGASLTGVEWGGPVVGFDLAVPLTFRFGHKRHWDFRIEPFDIFLHGKNVDVNYFGFRSTLGYRF